MIDLFNLPTTNNIQFFSQQGENVWQTWEKPRGCKFVYFGVFGAGGGGAGGQSGSGTARTGGGGGGSSQGIYVIIPSTMIPDTLFVNIGIGGLGGLPNSNGSGGTASFVSTRPETNGVSVVAMAYGGNGGTSAGVGGTAGSGALQNSLGSGIFTAAAAIGFCGVVNIPAIGGSVANPLVSGGAGGVNTGGNGTSVTTAHIVSGGAGGGGSSTTNVNGNGGSVGNGATIFPNVIGGNGGGTNNGGNGLQQQFTDYYINNLQLQGSGGAGGGAFGLGTGGNGGNGTYGCGGGGGGAGLTGGSGGNGGDGFVFIISI
jgi:hypothetical protein